MDISVQALFKVVDRGIWWVRKERYYSRQSVDIIQGGIIVEGEVLFKVEDG